LGFFDRFRLRRLLGAAFWSGWFLTFSRWLLGLFGRLASFTSRCCYRRNERRYCFSSRCSGRFSPLLGLGLGRFNSVRFRRCCWLLFLERSLAGDEGQNQ
jgi:hypothetical protein